MNRRPDKPLVVKCTFDQRNKRISFTSARNCSYDILKTKVEQCFSLYSSTYTIAYKDDDGEVSDITTDDDLTEAIQYFQAGTDDPPLSSATSILSGRSFGSRKITLRVHITVDYDGPALSDSGSIASLDDFKGPSGSQISFLYGSPPAADLDDDSVTVSSRDAGTGPTVTVEQSPFDDYAFPETRARVPSKASWDAQTSSNLVSRGPKGKGVQQCVSMSSQGSNPFSDSYHLSASTRFPANPSAVFERLKIEDEYDDLSTQRGAAWLKDQNDRTIKSMLGVLPRESESDDASLSDGVSLSLGGGSLHYLEDDSQMGGDLSLKQDPNGKYYYSYTSSGASQNHDGASQTHDSGYDDGPSEDDPSISGARVVRDDGGAERLTKPRPTSMHLTWLASHQMLPNSAPNPSAGPSHSRTHPHSHNSDPFPILQNGHLNNHDIPPEVLKFLPLTGPPPDQLTDCSECGATLEAIRYVCTTCGEKTPSTQSNSGCNSSDKGKSPDIDFDSQSNFMAYPPPRHRTAPSSSSSPSPSTFKICPMQHLRLKPLPSLPRISSSPASSSSTLAGSGLNGNGSTRSIDSGYELCSGCIESAGVIHALEVSLAPASSPNLGGGSPSSPEDAQRALSMWRRTAPKKGQLRHGYLEKVWGYSGWENVEQDDFHTCRCSTCNTVIINKRYKCASCQNFNLCRACYSQVHEIHPSHAFLVVPDRPQRSRSEPDLFQPPFPNGSEEQSMKHPGVKCAHCMLDILGARFHCAICEAIDICSNCESAGLPGNLDSADGGHNSSHIMIKIPYPLESNEVQTASRRAIHLWTGRDGPNVQQRQRSKPSSVVSSYARTVVGSSSRSSHSLDSTSDLDAEQNHRMFCSGCSMPIIGRRYQCANCSSSPTSYSLCSSCEERSYLLHDAMHVFIKLPRPVQRPIESPFPLIPKLYRIPVGPPPGTYNASDPKEYLKTVLHKAALCDRCMTRIEGEWFRCAYCAKDLCDNCEALDTHDDSHVFLVFKSIVDMQHFRVFADLENANGSPPVLRHPVYH